MNENFAVVGNLAVTEGGVAETVVIGFTPSYVRVINVNNLTVYENFSGMDAGTSIDTFPHADTQIAVNAAGSITLTANGFTLGADICDTTADVVRYLAIR